MPLRRPLADSMRLRVWLFVLLGFAAVAVPAYFSFQWMVNSTVVQLGTLFAEKQVLYDRHRGLGALIREVSLAETLAGSQAVRDWARDETSLVHKQRGIAELEHYRRSFVDGSYFFVVADSGNYYFNDSSNAYAANQYRYTLSPANPSDAWYYSLLQLGEGCHLNVNNDANIRVTKVWMNCIVREGRRVLGVLGTGIDLSSFIQEVVNVPQRGVTSMFVDRMGMIQAHRDETLVSLASFEDAVDSKRSVFSLVSGLGDGDTLRRLMSEVISGETLADSAFVTVDGKRTLVGIGYLDKLGWYNVTLMDIETIIDRDLFLPIGLLLAGIMALVTLVLVFVFKRTVLDRVSRLEQVVRKARKGDYGPARSMATGPQDEIGRLSSALTEMAENVDQTTRDLEERVQERTQELERLAFRDWQSGLLNRRGFTEAHRRAADAGEPYGVLLADVDHFKQINDSAGHGAGDLVIVDVARRIEACIGPGASVGRWGGDEFIIFLPKSSPHGLRATADDILHAVMDEGIKVSPEQTLAVSLSIGAFLAEGGVELEISTDRADAALYMAKEAGRGRVVVVDKDIRPKPPLQVA